MALPHCSAVVPRRRLAGALFTCLWTARVHLTRMDPRPARTRHSRLQKSRHRCRCGQPRDPLCTAAPRRHLASCARPHRRLCTRVVAVPTLFVLDTACAATVERPERRRILTAHWSRPDALPQVYKTKNGLMTTGAQETNIDRNLGRLADVLRLLVLVGSLGYMALYAILVCFRLRYPFELEWLEWASVDHVRTILAGEPLYAKPSLDFIPLTYTPGYFYLAAGLSWILGVGFLPLRMISIAAAVALLSVLFCLAWREVREIRAGVLAAGLFAAMFGWTDGWLDVGRTDSLFLLLTCLAIYVLRWHSSLRAAVLAGVLISLAFLVKQTGLIVAIPL